MLLSFSYHQNLFTAVKVTKWYLLYLVLLNLIKTYISKCEMQNEICSAQIKRIYKNCEFLRPLELSLLSSQFTVHSKIRL